MAIIYTYPEINQVEGEDLLLISDTSLYKRPTRSVTVDDLAAYIGTVVGVVQNLQSVLTVGNTYVSPDGYGTFTLNDITNNDGNIKYANTDEEWGYALNAEEGLYFTDGTGSATGSSGIRKEWIYIGNGNHIGTINSTNLTANRVFQLPNAAGTIALENLSEWYSVTGSRDLGNLVVKIGDYDGSGNGTFLTVDDNDQSMSFTKGNATKSKFIFNATQDRNYTFPDATGTIALTSDIPSPGPGGSGTTNYTARWTNANTLGIGTLYDNGTNVGIGTTSPDSLLEISTTDTTKNFIKLTSGAGSVNPTLIFEKSAVEQGVIQYIRNGDLKIYNTDSDGGVMLSGSSATNYDMYINNSGNVGIGTTSPSTKLHVQGAASGYLFRVQGTSTLNVYDPGAAAEIGVGSGSGDKLKLFSNDSLNNGITIDTSGNVGIGTTSPSEKLEVSGARSNLNGILIGENNSNIQFPGDGRLNVDNNDWLIISEGGVEVMRAGGAFQRLGIGTTSPLSKLNVNGDIKIEGENELYFGSSGSVPLWEIKASGSDLVINDTGSNIGSVLFNNDEGVVLPRLTTTEINAISLPNTGLTVYNTTLNTLCFYNGSSWQKVSHTNM